MWQLSDVINSFQSSINDTTHKARFIPDYWTKLEQQSQITNDFGTHATGKKSLPIT